MDTNVIVICVVLYAIAIFFVILAVKKYKKQTKDLKDKAKVKRIWGEFHSWCDSTGSILSSCEEIPLDNGSYMYCDKHHFAVVDSITKSQLDALILTRNLKGGNIDTLTWQQYSLYTYLKDAKYKYIKFESAEGLTWKCVEMQPKKKTSNLSLAVTEAVWGTAAAVNKAINSSNQKPEKKIVISLSAYREVSCSYAYYGKVSRLYPDKKKAF